MFEEMKIQLIDAMHQMQRSEKDLEDESGPRLVRELEATWKAFRCCLLEADKGMSCGAWPMATRRLLDARQHFGAITHHLMLKALTDRGIVWAEDDKQVVKREKS